MSKDICVYLLPKPIYQHIVMKKWIYFLLIILSFILYGNSITNDYAIDDLNISGEAVQKGFAGIPTILTNRYGVRGNEVALDYRPIVLISYAIENQFFIQDPHISHFINILLYALCLIALYNVLISVLGLQKIHAWLPLIITVFFAIHPIHTEVVNSLKNRDELFCFLFGMLFLKYGFLYFTAEKKVQYSILTILFFTLTLLSKLIGIIYFPIFILILLFNRLLKWNKWNYLLLSSSFFILIFITWTILSGLKRETYSFENSLIGITDILIIFPTCFKIILYHIKMLLLPFPLRFYYGYNLFPLESAFEFKVIFSILLHIGLLVYGIKQVIKNNVIGLIILCYLVSMFLYFNFPIPYTGMFSERALFLSSVWFISAIAIITFRLINKYKNSSLNKIFLIVSFLIFISYSFQTIQRNFYWKNTLTLLSKDISTLENSVAANYIYANILISESKKTTDSSYSFELAQKAAKHYQQAINLYPYYPDYFYQLAKIYRYNFNDINKAEKLFTSMLIVDSNFIGANYELGKIYFERRNFKGSYLFFEKAYQKNPTDSLTLFYFAQNALAVGDLSNCYKINKEFIDLYPNIKYPYLNLGVYYSTILKDDSAVIYFEKGIALGDRNPDLLKNMVSYFDKKQNKEKVEYYESILQQIK